MIRQTKSTRTVLQQKNTILKKAGETLKEESIGIDAVIDHIINDLTSWYLFHKL